MVFYNINKLIMTNFIYQIDVDGIKCIGCKNKIETEIKRFESVEHVSINVVLN